MNRRTVLKLLTTAVSAPLVLEAEPALPSQQSSLSLDPVRDTYKPLEEITIRGARQGKLFVSDGAGNVYVESPPSLCEACRLWRQTPRLAPIPRRLLYRTARRLRPIPRSPQRLSVDYDVLEPGCVRQRDPLRGSRLPILRELGLRPHPHSQRNEVFLAGPERRRRFLRRNPACRRHDLGELLPSYARAQLFRLEICLR
jgi:hypothetical protein